MALPPLRTCLRYTKYAAGTAFAASMTTAWYYRPTADKSGQRNNTERSENNVANGRADEVFCAPYTSPPWSRERVPMLLEWARIISIGATTIGIRIMMNTYGRYEIEDDEHYRHFLETVLGGNGRGQHQGLITVSNHRSLFDDPGVVSCLLPLPIAIQPKYNRWAICSQEYCYNDALPGIIKGYIGAGQVLPICRGGGIDQKLLLDFARHLACGEWCHLFPRVASGSGTNWAAEDNCRPTLEWKALKPSPVGKLKWGVGKLVAHAPVTPKVIPFAHRGMERLLPQDETTGKTKLRDNLLGSFLPTIFGGDADDKLHICVKFGAEITFDDLIDEHEAKHGTLRKYCGKVDAEEQYDKGQSDAFHEYWDSSREERVLYGKIVRRIESRLDAITKEVCGDGLLPSL